jgi:sodium/proline symporter
MANVQTLIGIGTYLVVMIVIGLWYARKSNASPEEYFLAKRGFGPWVAALSAEASDMSGWLLMGLPGVAYFTGYGEAFWTALGLFIGTWVNWALVAKRLRSYSQVADNAITLPEFFSKRFHDKNGCCWPSRRSSVWCSFRFMWAPSLLPSASSLAMCSTPTWLPW